MPAGGEGFGGWTLEQVQAALAPGQPDTFYKLAGVFGESLTGLDETTEMLNKSIQTVLETWRGPAASTFKLVGDNVTTFVVETADPLRAPSYQDAITTAGDALDEGKKAIEAYAVEVATYREEVAAAGGEPDEAAIDAEAQKIIQAVADAYVTCGDSLTPIKEPGKAAENGPPVDTIPPEQVELPEPVGETPPNGSGTPPFPEQAPEDEPLPSPDDSPLPENSLVFDTSAEAPPPGEPNGSGTPGASPPTGGLPIVSLGKPGSPSSDRALAHSDGELDLSDMSNPSTTDLAFTPLDGTDPNLVTDAGSPSTKFASFQGEIPTPPGAGPNVPGPQPGSPPTTLNTFGTTPANLTTGGTPVTIAGPAAENGGVPIGRSVPGFGLLATPLATGRDRDPGVPSSPGSQLNTSRLPGLGAPDAEPPVQRPQPTTPPRSGMPPVPMLPTSPGSTLDRARGRRTGPGGTGPAGLFGEPSHVGGYLPSNGRRDPDGLEERESWLLGDEEWDDSEAPSGAIGRPVTRE
ncbi:hypothetical protein GCM10027290_28240 [Micromonospora sonneratiae]|uniref:PPE family protein n=1 Tax=Micromonospora sonneratiae TaxID=1184706 RepID=A0ABW3Y9S6_9ACTN